MKFAELLKNQIIGNDINLVSFDTNSLSEWLKSNFVSLLGNHNISVNTITLTKLDNNSYKSLFSLNAQNEKDSYVMEFGILKSNEYIEQANEILNRLSVLFLEDNFSKLDLLNILKKNRFNLSKINNVNTLLIY
ncbi:MAG: hypothetical protein CL827_09820 [Crocinitomicaceae bacterium]|nr:hypothetical protein [Crocinitomicaceae bacterium]|tara:strand:- start:945 stop:1346 length:402 start_codon:yes stop_codon:yes gene_type:complete